MSDYDLDRDDDQVRTKLLDPAILSRLVRYSFPYWRRLLCGVVAVCLTSFLAVLPPLLVGALVDLVFDTGFSLPAKALSHIFGVLLPGVDAGTFFGLPPQTRLWAFAGLFFLVRILNFLLDWGTAYLLAGLGQRVIYDIRVEVFRHIHSLDLGWFHKNSVGRLVTRATNDVGALEQMFSVALVTIVKDVGMLIGITTILLVVNVKLGLITLSVMPLLIIATMIFRKASRAAYRRWRAALSRMNGFLAESLSGIRVVQLFGKERKNDAGYDRIGREYMGHFLAQRRAWAVFRPVNTTLSAAGIGLVLWFGGATVLLGAGMAPPAAAAAGAISVGVLVSFLGYAELFFAPIRDLTEKFDILQGAMTAAERIFATLDEKSHIHDAPDASAPGRLQGAVEFRGVNFEYEPGEPILKDLSFRIEPGASVAIVGHTGAGKTTIINLLCRLYDASEGAVLLDGANIRSLELSGVRKQVSVVHQDVFLFAGTVLDNLRLFDDEVPVERVREACEQVHAHRFIERLPGGYDATVEEGGKTFSAGERQLLSFARALIADPAILVLDEATSSVDSRTEEIIERALTGVTEGRTSVLIAHRLSTIQRADRILVMDRGRLRESGTHSELLAKRGIYDRLYRMQFSDEMKGPDPEDESGGP